MTYTNLDGTVPGQGLRAILRWQVSDRLAGRRRVSEAFATPRRSNSGVVLARTSPHLTWIGHATFVQRLGGQLVATDPVWSSRIHTLPRLCPPGIALASCPKLNVVTISHAHYDHLDVPTLRAIGKDALYIVPENNADVLARAVRLDPARAFTHALLARALAGQGQYAEAAAEARDALARDPAGAAGFDAAALRRDVGQWDLLAQGVVDWDGDGVVEPDPVDDSMMTEGYDESDYYSDD